MRKDKKFAESEYAVNPLYRRMKERFSMKGQVTIGDFMRNRARCDGYTVSDSETGAVACAAMTGSVRAPAIAAPVAVQQNALQTRKKSKASFLKRHATFFACLTLFLCIALTLSVIIPVWTSFSASAGNDGIENRTDATEEVIPEAVPTPAPEVSHPSFENVMDAFSD